VPSQLVCRPQRDLPVAVLSVHGTLDLLTCDALEQAIRRSLSAQPEAVLLDASGLEVGDPLGLAALGSALFLTSEWPGAPITLCGPTERTARAVAASPDCADIRLAPGVDQALAATAAGSGAGPRAPEIRVRLRPVPDACRQVRQLVSQACASWHLRDLAAVAQLVATELVANVVRHAHTTMEFPAGLRDGRICLAVRDGSRRLPQPADPGFADAGGRGLRLVRELTDAWGVLPVTDGKVVWTRLAAA
jgi:anti-anti-sigma regulatory factor/anti-sigma regulatory factor (Ser/Thr protein kinase)